LVVLDGRNSKEEGGARDGIQRPRVPNLRSNSCTGSRRDLRHVRTRVCSAVATVCIITLMATHVRKNITLPRSLDERLRKAARKRGTTQSGLIVHLVETGLAAEASQTDRLLSFVGVIHGPPDLSETIDETVYGS
jgi:hypothetical protein